METYLTFKLHKELFAVSVLKVLEVLQMQQITKVPKTPAHILGIINFRGDILPVIDTCCKFSLPSNADDKHIIIVFEIDNNNKTIYMAATADAVNDVIEISEQEIKSVPELGLSYDSNFMAGAIQRDEEFILLLNIEKVFSSADLNDIQLITTNTF